MPTFRYVSIFLISLYLQSSFALVVTPANVSTQQKDFLLAEKAIEENDPVAYQQLYAKLASSAYPLIPYLDFQVLSKKTSELTPQSVAEFTSKYKDSPLASRMRKIWKNQLFKRQQWDEFLSISKANTNNQETCKRLHALMQTNQTEKLFDLVDKLWLKGKSFPDRCDPAFKFWRDQQRLTPQVNQQRFINAIQNNQLKLARYLLKFFSNKNAHLARTWLNLYQFPEKLASVKNTVILNDLPEKLFVAIMKRWARKNASAASDYWQVFKQDNRDINIIEIDDYVLTRLFRDHDDSALTLFKEKILQQKPSTDLLKYALFESISRSRHSDALEYAKNLHESEPDSERWMYWLSKSLQENDQPQAATALLTPLSKERSYYGFLAADELEVPYTIESVKSNAKPQILAAVQQMDSIQRAYELRQLGRLLDARREWYWSIKNMYAEQFIAAANIAHDWGWNDQAIMTIARAKEFSDLELRFPKNFSPFILNMSKSLGIEPAWVMAVIRQESAFAHDARSGKGARGLMQLMPRTAKVTAKKINLEYSGTQQLFEPTTNITLGASYLHSMLNKFSSERVLATAAYNAGPHRVKQWLKKLPVNKIKLWIEFIPFKETQKYVKRVLTYTAIYQKMLQLPVGRLKDQLGLLASAESVGLESNK